MVSQRAARKEALVFGAYNDYIFCGSYGVDLMTKASISLTNARKLKRRRERSLSQKDISTSTGFAPGSYECKVANFGEMDPADRWPKAVKRQLAAHRNERLLYGLGDSSSTHPENQPYAETVKTNLKQREQECRITAWNTERICPLDSMLAALLQDPIQRKAGSTDANHTLSR